MAKPLANDGKLRAHVREVLCMAPGFALDDEQLFNAVRELLPMHSAQDSDILRAAEWNLAKDYVSEKKNEDTDNREWRITSDGIAKQSIK
jgi:hypothetical protein